MGSPTIFNGPFTKTLTDNLKLKEDKHIRAGDTDDPTTNPKNSPAGSLYLQSGSNKVFKKEKDGNNTLWKDMEAKAGELLLLKGDWYDTADASTGNNPTFDGGGTLQGSFALSSAASSLINGSKVFQLTLNATGGNSDDDYVNLGTYDIPQGYRGGFLKFTLRYRYNGASGDSVWRVKDTSNGTILSADTDTFDRYVNNDTATEKVVFIHCPSDCQQLEFGPQVLTHATGSEVLEFSDIKIEGFAELTNVKVSEQTIQHTAGNNTLLDLTGEVRFNTSNLSSVGDGLLTIVDNAASTRTEFTANADCLVDIVLSVQASGSGQHYIQVNGSAVLIGDRNQAANVYSDAQITGLRLSAGDYITFLHDSGSWRSTTNPAYVYIKATQNIETFKVESGVTENHFTAEILNSGAASIGSQSSSFIQSVNRTGAGQVTVTWVPGFFTVAPTVLAKTSSTGGPNAGDTQCGTVSTTNATFNTFNSTNSLADANFHIQVTRQDSDYRDPRRAFLLFNDVCHLSEQQVANTFAGTFTAGVATTRQLTSISGGESFCSLDTVNDRFTLSPGKYEIEAFAPAYQVNGHKAWLYNFTDSTNDIIGSSEYSGAANANTNIYSKIYGTVEFTSAKTFEIRHQCQTTRATDGLGTASNVAGLAEKYTFVKIKRVG